MKLPDSLEQWVEEGQLVRRSGDDVLAGRCGGILKRPNGSEVDGSRYCHRAAGLGTDHPGVGRCHFHPGLEENGLPPWVGEVSQEEWRRMTGARGEDDMDEDGSFKESHGAGVMAQRAGRSFEQIWKSYLNPEDRELWDSISVDPTQIIDHEIRTLLTMKGRILRWRREREMEKMMDPENPGGVLRDAATERAESSVRKIGQIIARLLEVRVRYSELAEAKKTDDALLGVLERLSSDDFSKIRSDPTMLSSFIR